MKSTYLLLIFHFSAIGCFFLCFIQVSTSFAMSFAPTTGNLRVSRIVAQVNGGSSFCYIIQTQISNSAQAGHAALMLYFHAP